MFRIFCLLGMLVFTIPVFGAVLHVGDNYVTLSIQRPSTPALVIRYPSGDVYYAKMSETDCGAIKIKYNECIFSVCPEEYTRVDFLASTGSGEYIDTEVFIDKENINKVKIEVEFSGTNNATWNIPIGIGYPTPLPYCFIGINHNKIAYGYNEDVVTATALTANQIIGFHTYSIDYSLGEIYFDGALVHSFQTQQFSGDTAFSLYMFTWNTNGEHLAYKYVSQKIKWARISIDSKLVRDYIPVLDTSGMPAMYDRVSGRYFYNRGSGKFEYGI